MSLLSIGETPRKVSHIGADFVRDCSRSFLALFGTGDDEMVVILNCGHGIFELHPSDSTQRVIDIRAELREANVTNPATNGLAHLWEIALTYGPWDYYNWASDGNPLHVPTRFRIDFTLSEVAAFEDVDGNPIVNAAGDPYDPPLMREVTRCTLTVLRNESPSSVDIPTLAALSNTLNRDTWNGFPAKTTRLNPLKLPEPVYSQVINGFYFPFEYVFDVNFDSWVKQIINAGFRQLDSGGNLVPILINGQPVTTPFPLDESGHAILAPTFKESTGDVPDDTDPGGYSGEVAGGGEPPEGGDGTSSGSNLVIDAYDLTRTADFSFLNMDNLFTLPTIP
jgi:hypothetical protein